MRKNKIVAVAELESIVSVQPVVRIVFPTGRNECFYVVRLIAEVKVEFVLAVRNPGKKRACTLFLNFTVRKSRCLGIFVVIKTLSLLSATSSSH